MSDATPLIFDSTRRDARDSVARDTGRQFDESLTEAVDAYLDVQRWQTEHIAEGLRQADAGDFASEEEVAAAFARWR